MAVHNHLIAFDRPLRAARLASGAERVHTAAELEAARAAGHQAGGDAARAFSDQQLVDLRAEFQALQEGVLKGLADTHARMVAEVREALPALAVDIGRRLLADFVPPPELVEKICREALDQLYPEREGLELVVGPRDAAAIERLAPGWRAHFADLRVTIDDMLAPGDCLVRSRFGVADARGSSKLDALRRELIGAA